MTETTFYSPRQTLTAKDREIAISSIGARVSGSPAEAAAQLLSGIAVLDGRHLPILVWPTGMSLKEAADWLAEQGEVYRVRAQRFSERMTGASSSELTALVEHSDPPQKLSRLAQPLEYPTSSASTHREAGIGSHSLEDQQLHSEASDAC